MREREREDMVGKRRNMGEYGGVYMYMYMYEGPSV